MIRYATILVVLLIASAIASAQPAPTTTPAGPEVDPAVAAFLSPMQAQSSDDDLRQKLIERHNTAVKLLQLRVQEFRRGLEPLSEVITVAGNVAEAKMDLAQNDEERMNVAQQTLDVMKVAEARIDKQIQAGFGTEADLDRARLARLNAEVTLLKLKQPKAASPATTRP